MFGNIELFRLSQAMAGHATTRLNLISQNVANADTPGYQAKDIAPFDALVRDDKPFADLRATRPGHVSGFGGGSDVVVEVGTTVSPNGNSVSVENELLKAAEVQERYDSALAIYKSGLNILRTSIGRR
ncbi:MAG: FlgB family protein [Paracoccaceae bacterium]|jgi:flagellar basal-body rod protein FlgB|nr:FlgB family protein [Paracoccaceae bacterium]MDP7186283.1 FlgB family protein [Paracoccaceae bacterium]